MFKPWNKKERIDYKNQLIKILKTNGIDTTKLSYSPEKQTWFFGVWHEATIQEFEEWRESIMQEHIRNKLPLDQYGIEFCNLLHHVKSQYF